MGTPIQDRGQCASVGQGNGEGVGEGSLSEENGRLRLICWSHCAMTAFSQNQGGGHVSFHLHCSTQSPV